MEDYIERYRALLTGPESLRALDDALELVQAALGVELQIEADEVALRELDGEHGGYVSLSDALTEGFRDYEMTRAEEVLRARRRKATTIEQKGRVLRVGAVLKDFSSFTNQNRRGLPLRQYSFLFDLYLLVFHQAYYALVPTLSSKWQAERDFLLECFFAFSEQLPAYADRCTVLALTYDLVGRPEDALALFKETVRATHSDSHEYMTVLQQCWTHLIDLQRYREAAELLVAEYSRVPRRDLEEVGELLLTTQDLAIDAAGRAA